MKTVYLSGKITGCKKEETVKKFEKFEKNFSKSGYRVISPLKNGLPWNVPWLLHMMLDIILLVFRADCVFFMADWKQSRGAKIEKKIAEATGKLILVEDND